MDNINAFVICLESKKMERCGPNFNNIKKVFPNLHWFTAIDGKKLNLEDIDINPIIRHHILENHNYDHDHISNDGEIGCYLSHIELWKKCVEINKPIIVIEDDMKFGERVRKVVKKSLTTIPKDADFASLIFLSITNRRGNAEHKKYETENWSRIGAEWCGMQCYYITPRGARILLKSAFPISTAIDAFVSYVSHTDKNFIAYKTKNNPYTVLQNLSDHLKTTLGTRLNFKKICPNDNIFYVIFLIVIPLLFIIFFITTLVLINAIK